MVSGLQGACGNHPGRALGLWESCPDQALLCGVGVRAQWRYRQFKFSLWYPDLSCPFVPETIKMLQPSPPFRAYPIVHTKERAPWTLRPPSKVWKFGSSFEASRVELKWASSWKPTRRKLALKANSKRSKQRKRGSRSSPSKPTDSSLGQDALGWSCLYFQLLPVRFSGDP